MNSSWDSLSKLSNVWVFSEQKKFSLQTEIVAVEWSMLISWFDGLDFEGTTMPDISRLS